MLIVELIKIVCRNAAVESDSEDDNYGEDRFDELPAEEEDEEDADGVRSDNE